MKTISRYQKITNHPFRLRTTSIEESFLISILYLMVDVAKGDGNLHKDELTTIFNYGESRVSNSDSWRIKLSNYVAEDIPNNTEDSLQNILPHINTTEDVQTVLEAIEMVIEADEKVYTEELLMYKKISSSLYRSISDIRQHFGSTIF